MKVEQTVATQGVPPVPSPMLPELPPATGILGAVVTVVSAVLFLRRRLSKDGLQVSKESAESTMLKTAIAERDKAMANASEAWRSRAEDAATIGRLSSDVKHLTESNNHMTAEVSALRKEIKELHVILQSLSPVGARIERRVEGPRNEQSEITDSPTI